MLDASPPTVRVAALGVVHRRRLRDVYRSAGWPCQDGIEVELLAAGLLQRQRGPLGHETLRVTDAGLAVLAESLARNRARRDAHEQLVERVAREMTRAGRLAWRGLAVRARVEGGWAMAMPDVFSIRHTTVEAYAEPIVHEVKVQRADLLADLRRAAKRQAYLDVGGECWYVIKEGIARVDEIPPECGVLVAAAQRLEVARPAPRRPTRIGFALWMALARATPVEGWRFDEAQLPLGEAAAATMRRRRRQQGPDCAIMTDLGEAMTPTRPARPFVAATVVAAFGALALAGCDKPASSVAASMTQSPSPQSASSAAAAGSAPQASVDHAQGGIAWRQASSDAEIDAAFAAARSVNKPVFVYWGAKWCPPCNQVKATLFNRQDFIERSRAFVPVYVDGDSPGAQKIGARFHVSGYPTMVLFSPQGQEVTRLPGEVEPVRYTQVLTLGMNAARPVSAVLADALARPASLDANDWRLLAFYSWDTDQQQVIAKDRLARRCSPSPMPARRTASTRRCACA